VGDDRGGSQRSGRSTGVAWRRPLPGQLGRIGVEAETNLTATLSDERRKPIRKQLQKSAALDFGLEGGAGGEAGHFAAGNRDPLPGARVHSLAGPTLGNVEFAEAGEADLVARAQSSGDCVENSVDSVAGSFLAAEPIVAGKLVQKFSLGHVENPPRGLKTGRNITVATA
jgi:hypothetical protein